MRTSVDTAEIQKLVADSVALKQRFFSESGAQLVEVGRRLAECVLAGGRVLAFGNGGSAADAQHFVAELVGRLERERRALSAIALTTDPSVVTAVSNDMGYAAVFRRQVEAHGRAGDVALGISTSGRSRNVVLGLEAARDGGLVAAALSVNDGGLLRGLADPLLVVPSRTTARIQEMHIMLGQMLCGALEIELGLA